jgi:hypothetical protein
MRKTVQLAVLAGTLLTAPFALTAQEPTHPTFTKLGEIDIAAVGITPTDIAFLDGHAYVSCFAANRQIVKISNVLSTTPTANTFAVTSGPGSTPAGVEGGPITWAGGRGLTSIQVHPDGRVLAAGDPGSGPLAVVEYNPDGTLLRIITIPTPFVKPDLSEVAFQRLNVARYFGDNILIGGIFGQLLQSNAEMTALTDPYVVTGHPNFTRGIAFVGDNIFVRQTSNGPDRIHRYTGGTFGSLAGFEYEGLEFAEIGPSTFNTSSGIQPFSYAGDTPFDYLVANKTSAPIAIQFYDPETDFFSLPAAPLFIVDDVTLGLGQLLALGFATTDAGQYMLVGRTAGATLTNYIEVWGVDGAQLVELPPEGTLGDINNDGEINVADVTELGNLLAAGTPPPNEIGDVNLDEVVNDADVAALAELIVDSE